VYCFPIIEIYLYLLTNNIQNTRRKKFPAKAPMNTENTKPPKNTIQDKSVKTFPLKNCGNKRPLSRRKPVIQRPKQKMTTIKVSALTTRPAQVCASARSAWLETVSLPEFHNRINFDFISLLSDLVIGCFFRYDHIVRMTFYQPCVGYTHKACCSTQIIQGLCSSIPHP
jgi:hypothetical protein